MERAISSHLQRLIERRPEFESIKEDIVTGYYALSEAFHAKGKLLICGNGGSAADADHIVGELMKGFLHKRPLTLEIKESIERYDESGTLLDSLQMALPAINLSAHVALSTAICNDTSSEAVFAQQVLGYGVAGDILLGISTSGNSSNVLNAGIVAKSIGMKTIGLTGRNGCKMDKLFDIVIRAPSTATTGIQEFHLLIYHTLCAMLEEEFFETQE